MLNQALPESVTRIASIETVTVGGLACDYQELLPFKQVVRLMNH